MARIAVVTDSAACIPEDLRRQYNIHVVPFELVWNGQSYHDGVDITPTEVYRRLRELREENSWPTTSQPALGTFANLYAELSTQADGIVSIHVPDELSGTLHTARLAAEQAATVESPEYLRRGGRIGEAAAMLGARLRIHPILYLAEGRVKVAGVTRNRRQALERILNLMEERVGRRPMCAAVFHADAGDDVVWIEVRVRERFDCQHFYITEFTPVMGVHTGPGVIGLAFCARDTSSRE